MRAYAYRPKIAGSKKRYPKYKIRFFDDAGKYLFQEATDYTDGRAAEARAQERLRELEREAHDRKMGKAVTDARPIADILAEYLEEKSLKGGLRGRPWSPVYREKAEPQLRWWLQVLGVRTLKEITLAAFDKALAEKAKAGRYGRPVRGHGLNNTAMYLTAFCNWCVDKGYLAESPLAKWTPFNQDPDKTWRDYSITEFRALLQVTTPARRLAYLVAVATGLRLAALKGLRREHMDWREGILTVPWLLAKNKRLTRKHLPRWIVALLQQDGAPSTAPLLPGLQGHHGARDIQRELARAGVAIQTPEGKLVFHSLRVTFSTLLNDLGEDAKTIQEAMDHSSPSLTFTRYVKGKEERRRALAERLGETIQDTLGTIPSIKGVTTAKPEDSNMALSPSPMGGYQRKRGVGTEGIEPSPHLKQKQDKPRTAQDSAIRAPKGNGKIPAGHPKTNSEYQGSNNLTVAMGDVWDALATSERQAVHAFASGLLRARKTRRLA